MATITFFEDSDFTDATARDWLGWRHEVATVDFTTLSNGTRVFHYDIYNLQSNFSANWAGWYISYLGPQAFTGSFPHPHPAFPNDPNLQHSHAASGIADRFFIRQFGLGDFVEVTGLSVNLNALGAIHPASAAYSGLPTWEAKVTAAYNDYTAAVVQAFGGGNDTFNGSSRRDVIYGYGGNDTVFGNGGNDTIDGGVGFDTLHGGPGDDFFILNDATGATFDSVVEAANAGFDTVSVGLIGAANFYQLTPNVERGLVHSTVNGFTLWGNESSNLLYGNAGNDSLSGRGGDDYLNGGVGFDTLSGDAGNDTLEGAAGLDQLRGGPGNDTFILTEVTFLDGAEFFDNVLENAGEGTDTVRVQRAGSLTAYALPANVENGVVIGSSGFDLHGNGLNNSLTGNDADNVLLGGAGNDFLGGGGGSDTLDGGAGNDTINGGDGLGTLFGGEGNDFIRGGIHNDTLKGGGGDDELRTGNGGDNFAFGEDGNDILIGENTFTGSNQLFGGPGNDTLIGGGTNDALNGEAGIDVVSYAAYTVAVHVFLGGQQANSGGATGDTLSGVENLIGTAFNDTLSGDANDNVFNGRQGADAFFGGAGIDTVDYSSSAGGVGAFLNAPQINNGADAAGDTFNSIENLIGSSFGDILSGDANPNVIWGLGGNDYLSGSEGNDTLFGGLGDDYLNGFDGADALLGESGADTATYEFALAAVTADLQSPGTNTGWAAGDTYSSVENLDGGEFGDTLRGDGAVNFLRGWGGNDLLDGRGGNDRMIGGAGDDRIFVRDTSDIATEAAGEGNDTVYAALNYALTAGAHVENLSTTSNAGTAAINLAGNALAQTITGNDGANTLDSGAGAADTLIGRLGNDRYFVRNAGDKVIELAGQGTDAAFAAVSYALTAGAHVESLSTISNAGVAAVNLTGNALAQTITGNDGVNTLDSGAGAADTLVGRLGDDRYLVRNAGDKIVELAGQGNDWAFASTNYALAAGVNVESLSTTGNTGIAAINLTGNALAQTITGNDGANTLDSWTGAADTLVGRLGDDRYLVRNVGDKIVELAGQGNDWVYSAVNYTLTVGVHVENLSTTGNTGTVAINLAGNELAQTITGNDGANALNGRGGNDTLNGRGGADIFLFNTALNAATNVDTIVGYVVADDAIHLENAIFTGLAAGALAAGAFGVGAAAADADDRIIYNSATGALIFDADGNAAGGATQFATLTPGLAMSAAEFFVV